MLETGRHGGTVLRRFEGGGRVWKFGDEVTPEQAAVWRPAARVGLGRTGYVFWYTTPRSVEQVPLPDVVIVRQPDGTEVVATLVREDDALVAVVQVPIEVAPPQRAGRGKN